MVGKLIDDLNVSCVVGFLFISGGFNDVVDVIKE